MREAFHDAFVAALSGDLAALAPWSEAPDLDARLSVYRNTVAKGCADALVAQFPTVAKLVGEPWLGAAAVEFARAHPPTEAALLTYGADFPAWLETFAPAADMPWLPGLAALDYLWTEAHLAADAPPLDPAALQALAPEDFARLRLVLHPAARFASFEAAIPSLWLALQAETPPAAFELGAEPEGLLFLRPALDITPIRLAPGAFALLAACRDRRSLAEAAAAALAAEPRLDLQAAFAELILGGAFAELAPLETA
ncbi:MAG: putative DNA-binding domain-containing protein [Caulobacterales bacterium]|nr:putative DNA-binding domain-containing protein [Caulobacterales bacterium]